jgi:predicted ATPase
MNAAHGGQVLVSQAVATLAYDRLPDGASLRDLGVVRLRDLSRPEQIYQVAHPLLRREFPALRSLEATPNNLPRQVTSFVGRESSVADVTRLLRSNRLATLVGAGGIGKTRLSLQAAAQCVDDYPDGVWFVELAALDNPRLVPQAVASVTGVKEEPGLSVIDALIEYFRDRRRLLILDNCEHLALACAELTAALLQSGPHTKVLASSREPLRIAGETAYAVPTLAVPRTKVEMTREALAQCEAVQLFVDRAIAAQPSFELTSQNAAAVADICSRLEGIPLALELAAARVRTLPVATIAERLGDRFRFLTGGSRNALPRHQTLRALIDWSFDLLTQDERVVLQRLTVFAGGWTLDAAEAVAAGGEIAHANVVDILIALVEKSLVLVDAADGRYGLLETVRQYAAERLTASTHTDEARTRHLTYFLTMVETARAGLTGPDQGIWLARLDLERENLLTAYTWCDHAENGGQLGLRLVYALQPYLLRRGVMALGHEAIAAALARPNANTRNALRCKALFAGGWQTYYMGRYEDALRYLEEGLSIAREIGDPSIVAMVLQPLAMTYSGRGETKRAAHILTEALALAREVGNRHQILAALNALGQLSRMEGELDRAAQLYVDVLAMAREDGNRESIAFALLNLAMALIGQQRADAVQGMLLEALEIGDELGSMLTVQSVLEVSSGLAALKEDWANVGLFFGAAEALAARTGLHRDPADEAFLAPLLAQARVTLGEQSLVAAVAEGRSLSEDIARGKVRAWLEATLPCDRSVNRGATSS